MAGVEVKTKVEYVPFLVPRFIQRMDGDGTLSSPIDKIDPDVIDALAADWLDRLYKSVGRSSPFQKVLRR